MPAENLHMTTMEIAHSRTELDITAQVSRLEYNLKKIADFTFSHRAKLIRPLVSYDTAAVALSFVPASDGLDNPYTYHHLRRDLHNLCEESGAIVQSRYVVPSAHLTIGRFVTQADVTQNDKGLPTIDRDKVTCWVAQIEQINQWLRHNFWSDNDGEAELRGEWVVGQENGLDCCRGRLWYGDGIRIRLGKGF